MNTEVRYESLECGLKCCFKNEYAKSKIEVINMVINDLEQIRKTTQLVLN